MEVAKALTIKNSVPTEVEKGPQQGESLCPGLRVSRLPVNRLREFLGHESADTRAPPDGDGSSTH